MQRSILITGCSSGIGLDAARTLKDRGWRVIATARTPQDLEALRTVEGVDALHLELADPKSIATCAVAALELTNGKLDAIFNNSGYAQPGAMEDITPAMLREQFEVNVIGPHDLTRRIIPAMRRHRSGRIVQCSSVLGFVSGPFRGPYCASKHALEALSTSMRMELAGTGIHVSLIEPGPIRTRFVEHAARRFEENIDIEGSVHRDTYRQRLAFLKDGGQSRFKMEPEAVTRKLLYALESARPWRRYYVTTPTYLAAGFQRFLPGSVTEYFTKRF